MTAKGAPLKGDILVVDDHAPNLEVMFKLLSRFGYSVRAVTSGERALESARLATPDCIVLDVSMPGINGFETCLALREIPELKHVPVVFLTALDDLPSRLKAFSSGGQDYVSKPFQAEELLARVETHVKLYRAQRELSSQNSTLVAASAQMAQANAMRARMTAMLVHDIRSPLTVVRCALDLAEEGIDEETLLDARNAFDKVLGMVQELLEVFRVEHKEESPELNTVDLVPVVSEAVAAARLPARNHGIELTLDNLAPNLILSGDANKLDRVTANLLDNAIKFSKAGQGVHITLTSEDGRGVETGTTFAVISVRDGGPGIDSHELPHIFDPYRQRGSSRERGSVGLGLAIVQRFVADHDGRVLVRSKLGVGTEFLVYLPLLR